MVIFLKKSLTFQVLNGKLIKPHAVGLLSMPFGRPQKQRDLY